MNLDNGKTTTWTLKHSVCRKHKVSSTNYRNFDLLVCFCVCSSQCCGCTCWILICHAFITVIYPSVLCRHTPPEINNVSFLHLHCHKLNWFLGLFMSRPSTSFTALAKQTSWTKTHFFAVTVTCILSEFTWVRRCHKSGITAAIVDVISYGENPTAVWFMLAA